MSKESKVAYSLPPHVVETFITEIKGAVAVKGERDGRIGRNPGGTDGRSDSTLGIDGVHVTAEIREVELSANFAEVECVEAQSGLADDCLLTRGRIDFCQTPRGIGATGG